MAEDLQDSGVRHWTDMLARIRFGVQTVNGRKISSAAIKAVGNRLSSYADYRTGGRVRPGLERLAVDLEVDYNTAKAAVAVLRRVGLLRVVSAGSRYTGAAMYQLVIPADILERDDIEVLSPAAHTVAIERERDKIRMRTAPKSPVNVGTPEACVEPVDNFATPIATEASQGPTNGAESPFYVGPFIVGKPGYVGPWGTDTEASQGPTTTHGPTTKEISQPSAGVGTAVTVAARASPAEEDPIPCCPEAECVKGWIFTAATVSRCRCNPQSPPHLRLIQGGQVA